MAAASGRKPAKAASIDGLLDARAVQDILRISSRRALLHFIEKGMVPEPILDSRRRRRWTREMLGGLAA